MKKTIIIKKKDIEDIAQEEKIYNHEDIILSWCRWWFKIKENKVLRLDKRNIVYINDRYKDTYHVLIEY